MQLLETKVCRKWIQEWYPHYSVVDSVNEQIWQCFKLSVSLIDIILCRGGRYACTGSVDSSKPVQEQVSAAAVSSLI